MRRMTPLALVLALAAPAAVLAQAGPGAGRGAMFDQLDANRDGVLSREEFMAMPARGPGPGQGRMGPGMMGGGRESGAGPGGVGGTGVPPMFGHIDQDGSGAIEAQASPATSSPARLPHGLTERLRPSGA